MNENLVLSPKTLEKMTNEKLDTYKKFNNLEAYAMYMGKAQILEFGLKNLLNRKCNIDFDEMEKWPLGKVKNVMKQNNFRMDFVFLLAKVVKQRNFIAHEFLVNNILTKDLGFSSRKLYGELFRSIYNLEKIIIVYDWLEENDIIWIEIN